MYCIYMDVVHHPEPVWGRAVYKPNKNKIKILQQLILLLRKLLLQRKGKQISPDFILGLNQYSLMLGFVFLHLHCYSS